MKYKTVRYPSLVSIRSRSSSFLLFSFRCSHHVRHSRSQLYNSYSRRLGEPPYINSYCFRACSPFTSIARLHSSSLFSSYSFYFSLESLYPLLFCQVRAARDTPLGKTTACFCFIARKMEKREREVERRIKALECQPNVRSRLLS